MANSGITGIRSAIFTIITSLRDVHARLKNVTRVVGAIIVIVAVTQGVSEVLATATWSNARISGASIPVVTVMRGPTASLLSSCANTIVVSADVMVITVAVNLALKLVATEVALTNKSRRAKARGGSAGSAPAVSLGGIDNTGADDRYLDATLGEITE